jgi:hypothetical protein
LYCLQDEEDGEEDVERGITVNLMIASLLAMQSTFQFGYNSGVINGCKDVVFPGHTEVCNICTAKHDFSNVWSQHNCNH